MVIKLRNKHILEVDEFQFRCCIGKKGVTNSKVEGDLCTPKGTFRLKEIFFRNDRVKLLPTKIRNRKIIKNMGLCNDIKSTKYNKLININEKYKHEKLYRKDNKYDYLIVLDYNFRKPIRGKGSAIFLHLTKNYRPTAGCIAINQNDFEILLKLIKKKTFIKI